MAVPTIEEERLLIEFRERVKDILETDDHQKSIFLIRWIRARDYNLDKAENMLRYSLAWRKENQVDQLLELPINDYFRTEFPWEMRGFSKFGHPICLIQLRKWDCGKLTTTEKMEQFKIYLNYCFEVICNSIKKANDIRNPSLYPVTQYIEIADWSGFSYMRACNWKMIQSALYAGSTYEAHYPEILFRGIGLNCPSYANILKMMAKQVLAPKTFEKIRLLGPNRAEWKAEIKEVVEEDEIPAIFKFFSQDDY